jgi:transposase-like protein
MPTLKVKLKPKLKRNRMSTRTSRTPETIQRNKKGDASASPFLCFCPVLNKVYTSHPEFPEIQMEQGVKRTQRDYSLAFKLAVVDQIEKGELTYQQAQERYGIQGRSTVLVWLRKHGRQDWSQGASIRVERSLAVSDPKTLTPEQRIKELEQQLELMSQKAEFFETVVGVLKNDYSVSLVKKRSGKSSRKAKSKG